MDANDDLLENGNPESEVEKLSVVKKRKRNAMVSGIYQYLGLFLFFFLF